MNIPFNRAIHLITCRVLQPAHPGGPRETRSWPTLRMFSRNINIKEETQNLPSQHHLILILDGTMLEISLENLVKLLNKFRTILALPMITLEIC